jgi:hypothetical protein
MVERHTEIDSIRILRYLGSGDVGCMTSVGHLDPADLDELT